MSIQPGGSLIKNYRLQRSNLNCLPAAGIFAAQLVVQPDTIVPGFLKFRPIPLVGAGRNRCLLGPPPPFYLVFQRGAAFRTVDGGGHNFIFFVIQITFFHNTHYMLQSPSRHQELDVECIFAISRQLSAGNHFADSYSGDTVTGMGFFQKLFSAESGPSERQIQRALKQTIQMHGEAATRVAAMERLASWGTPESAAALLRRFTVQTPQASMDLEEKQYAVKLLIRMGRIAVEPISAYLKVEPDVTFPVKALKEILPPEEFHKSLTGLLTELSAGYTRWPEAKSVLIGNLPDDAFPQVVDTVTRFLEDDDDDVCIAAIDYLARNGEETIRENLLQTFLDAEARPRVRGRILGHFYEREWPVKGYRKKIEEAIVLPFYLTSKGTVKRKSD